MSENQNRGPRDYSMYDAMSTEELEEILRLDMETPAGEESDIDMILYVMEVLDKRKAKEDRPEKTAQEAYEEFKTYYLPGVEEDPGTGRRSGMTRRLAAAAAVLAVVFLGTLTADAFGANIWGTIARWTRDTFHFESVQHGETTTPNTENNMTYSSLQEALSKHGIDEVLVPTWIPDGYVLADIKIEETPTRDMYNAIYQNSYQSLAIIVRSKLNEDTAHIEKSEDPLEVYESAGMVFYIFSNYEWLQAAWVIDSYECYVQGNVTIEELKLMLDSITEG